MSLHSTKTGGWRGVILLSALVLILLVLFTPFHPIPPTTPLPSHRPGTPKYAFATFLSGHYEDTNATTSILSPDNADDAKIDADNYYLSTRLLAYQLLHSPLRSNLSIDFVVFITDDVSDAKRNRLMRDGASVVLAGKVHSDWLAPESRSRNQDRLSKLRLWQMGQYERVCFLEPDHLLLRSLDGVFADPATLVHQTRADKFAVHADEATLPDSYGFAAQQHGRAHAFDPAFFVLKPGLDVLAYYSSLLAAHIHGRFGGGADAEMRAPEQALLNYAHRAGGNMPWQKLRGDWSVGGGGKREFEGGAAAFHERFWREGEGDKVDRWLVGRWKEVRREMEAFWRLRDGGGLGRG